MIKMFILVTMMNGQNIAAHKDYATMADCVADKPAMVEFAEAGPLVRKASAKCVVSNTPEVGV